MHMQTFRPHPLTNLIKYLGTLPAMLAGAAMLYDLAALHAQGGASGPLQPALALLLVALGAALFAALHRQSQATLTITPEAVTLYSRTIRFSDVERVERSGYKLTLLARTGRLALPMIFLPGAHVLDALRAGLDQAQRAHTYDAASLDALRAELAARDDGKPIIRPARVLAGVLGGVAASAALLTLLIQLTR